MKREGSLGIPQRVRGRFIVLMSLAAIISLGASLELFAKEEEPRYQLYAPAGEIVSAATIYVAPLSIVQKYAPCGNQAVDEYLASTPESFQAAIVKDIEKRLAKKEVASKVETISAEAFNTKITAALKEKGLEGFFDPNTGKFNSGLFDAVMTNVAAGLDGCLFVPRLMQKKVQVRQLWTHETAPKAKWDGVSRKVEKGGFIAHHDESMEGTMIPVLSLRLDGYGKAGKLFWSEGGFDLLVYVKYSPINLLGGAKAGGASVPTSGLGHNKEKESDVGDLLGPKNSGHENEAVALAVEPLFAK